MSNEVKAPQRRVDANKSAGRSGGQNRKTSKSAQSAVGATEAGPLTPVKLRSLVDSVVVETGFDVACVNAVTQSFMSVFLATLSEQRKVRMGQLGTFRAGMIDGLGGMRIKVSPPVAKPAANP
jgi:hypothetical protein